jgi:hypothetical protein
MIGFYYKERISKTTLKWCVMTKVMRISGMVKTLSAICVCIPFEIEIFRFP